MSRGLRDDVQYNAAGRPGGASFEPRCVRQRLRGVQVGQGPHHLVSLGGHLLVLLKQVRQRLAFRHPERVRPGVSHGGRVECHRGRPFDDEPRPPALGKCHMLDQTPQAKLTDRRAPRRLLIRQPSGREAQEMPLLGQRRQQVGALFGHSLRRAHSPAPPLAHDAHRQHVPPYHCQRCGMCCRPEWLRADMPAVVIAAAYGGPEVLTLVDEPTAEPGPGEARIAIMAAGVNPVDQKMYSGAFNRDPAELPMRLGLEAAGIVTHVGPDAVGPAGPVRAGDEVIAFRAPGAYANELVVPAQSLIPKPAALDWAQASGLMLTGATAWHCLVATA